MQKSSSQVRAYAQVGDFITAYQALLQLAIDEVWQRIRWVERPARVKRKTPPSSILDPPLLAAQLPQWRAEQGAPGSQAEVRRIKEMLGYKARVGKPLNPRNSTPP